MLKNQYTVEVCPTCGDRVQWMEIAGQDGHVFGWHCTAENKQVTPETIVVEPVELEFERLGKRNARIPLSG